MCNKRSEKPSIINNGNNNNNDNNYNDDYDVVVVGADDASRSMQQQTRLGWNVEQIVAVVAVEQQQIESSATTIKSLGLVREFSQQQNI